MEPMIMVILGVLIGGLVVAGTTRWCKTPTFPVFFTMYLPIFKLGAVSIGEESGALDGMLGTSTKRKSTRR
jgi:hypothetical protein